MSTSGSTNYSLTTNTIIRKAYEFLGVYTPSDTIAPEDVASALDWLNMMVKSWQTQGVYLWKEGIGTLFLQKGTRKYTLGPSGDHGSDTTVRTTLSASAASSATTLTVTSSTGMTAGDYIGVELDSGTLYWTTIVSVASSTSVTITSGLTSAATSGNQVYTYTTRIGKPLHITSATVRDENDFERPLQIDAREDYFNTITDKYQEGDVYRLYFQPRLTSTDIYLYQVPNSTKKVIEFSYYKAIEDFDNSSDDPDFPSEFTLCLVVNLAKYLAPGAGKDQKYINTIAPQADDLFTQLKEWSHEHNYIQVNPTDQWYQ